jgi:hypothetical protein
MDRQGKGVNLRRIEHSAYQLPFPDKHRPHEPVLAYCTERTRRDGSLHCTTLVAEKLPPGRGESASTQLTRSGEGYTRHM